MANAARLTRQPVLEQVGRPPFPSEPSELRHLWSLRGSDIIFASRGWKPIIYVSSPIGSKMTGGLFSGTVSICWTCFQLLVLTRRRGHDQY